MKETESFKTSSNSHCRILAVAFVFFIRTKCTTCFLETGFLNQLWQSEHESHRICAVCVFSEVSITSRKIQLLALTDPYQRMRRPTYSSASFRGKQTNKQKTAVCNSHSWHYDVVTSLDLDLLIHIKSFHWNSALFMYSFKSNFSKVCLNFTYHIETNELLIHCGLKIAVLQIAVE